MRPEDLIKALMQAAGQEEQGFKSRTEALELLQKYTDAPKPDFKKGDYVERNELGKVLYNFPRDNQAAVVVQVFDEPNENGEDIAVMVALSPGSVRRYLVDSKFYRDAAGKVNIVNFRRKDL